MGLLEEMEKLSQELLREALRGTGWNVLKVIWGPYWDKAFNER